MPFDRNYPTRPRKVRGGIRARSETGEFAKNWWAQRWLEAMERLMDRARLGRGQRYARMGQVLSIEEDRNGIVAQVQGSRPRPYKVNLRVAHFTDAQWEAVLDVLSGQAIFAAQLLAGEMPPNIEEAFSKARVSLFPSHAGDLITECSCPDWANPCKHIAATHYILGDRFDEDPFLLFRLRGRTQEQILEGLRKRRTATAQSEAGDESDVPLPTPAEAEPLVPLEERLDKFWEMAAPLDEFAVQVHPPSIPLPILKRLGEPDFSFKLSMEDLLGEAYEMMSQAAMVMAYRGMEAEPPEPDEA